MLGFFVAAMISRWWSIYFYIPRIVKPAFLLQSYIPASIHVGKQEGDKDQPAVDQELRRCILRYMNLAWIIQMGGIAQSVQDRFPVFRPDAKGGTIRQRLQVSFRPNYYS